MTDAELTQEALIRIPDVAKADLTIRIGEPRGRSRGGWKHKLNFTIENGLSVLEQICYERFDRVRNEAQIQK
jgi:hypothetical protein